MTIELLSAVSDRRRLAVLGALCAAHPPSTLTELRDRTGYAEREIQRALAVLGGAGLVVRGAGGLEVDLTPIRKATASAVGATPLGRLGSTHPRLGGCVKNGRVATIPVDDDLKAELGRIVMSALPERSDYTEPELTDVLATIGDEPVALRRLLVDLGLMVRRSDGGRYWRA